MTEAWKFRSGTLDRAIFNGVVLYNEYELPSSFEPGDIVLDVGAHIGSFAHAAVARGCENVYAIEADRLNCEIAAENLRPYIKRGFVELVRGAVWRSDQNTDELYLDGYQPFPASYVGMEGIINTGSGSVMWGGREPVPKIAFDEIVDLVTNRGEKRVRLLKLDCEGAEWPILLTSRRLDLIDEICGEFHEIGGEFHEISENRPSQAPIFRGEGEANFEGEAKFTVEGLVSYLGDAGFAVRYRRHMRPTGAMEGLGLFFASRGARPLHEASGKA
ncbi:MAG TPA: FkbM family methyltransferase [Pyrinomonadaceae bacterium]|jgi:FkbM family methyltransferase|nr:FkbM family methyltransferase [Pyrinomonadaceae bacterium]